MTKNIGIAILSFIICIISFYKSISAGTTVSCNSLDDHKIYTSMNTQASTDNTSWNEQWYLNSIGLYDNLPKNHSSVIAIIDSGIQTNHPALADSLWVNEPEYNGIEGIDDDGNGYTDDIYGYNVRSDNGDVTDTNGHGTHVAGIIAMNPSTDNNAKGIYPKTKLMIIKAGNSTNGFSSNNIIKAIRYAMVNNADVINLSLGASYCSDELRDICMEASKNSVLVAAAGNDSSPTAEDDNDNGDNTFPAGLNTVLGVMSYNINDELSWFSNWDYLPNSDVEYELIAPGENIYSTTIRNRYKTDSGTSMSTPMVSAACAILIDEWKRLAADDAAYSPDIIRDCLINGSKGRIQYTDDSGRTHEYTRLDISGALSYMKEHYILPANAPASTSVPTPNSDTSSDDNPTANPKNTPAPSRTPDAGHNTTPTIVPDNTVVPTHTPDTGHDAAPTAAPIDSTVPTPCSDTGSLDKPAAAPDITSVPTRIPVSSQDSVQAVTSGNTGNISDLTNSSNTSDSKKNVDTSSKKQKKTTKRIKANLKIKKGKKYIILKFHVKNAKPKKWVIYRSEKHKGKKNGAYSRYAICKKNKYKIRINSKKYDYKVYGYLF